MCKKKKLYARKQHIKWEVGPEYEIESEIGSRSNGSVCEAIEVAPGETVAIKQISGIFNSLAPCEHYLREVFIMRRLNHPNVLKLRDIVKPHNLKSFNELYLVIEYAPSDLKNLIKSPITLEEDHIQLILYNILCGLRYIHSANILQRDLKPPNVLIYSNCELKICDFWLSRSDPIEIDSHYSENKSNQDSSKDSSTLTRAMTSHVVTR